MWPRLQSWIFTSPDEPGAVRGRHVAHLPHLAHPGVAPRQRAAHRRGRIGQAVAVPPGRLHLHARGLPGQDE